MDSLVGLSDVGVSDERPHCPICFELAPFAKGLENHLAHHLERLAMFALPKYVEGAAEDVASTADMPDSQKIRERSFASGYSLGPPEFSDHGAPNSASSDKEAGSSSPWGTEPRQSETFDSKIRSQIARLANVAVQIMETYDKIKDIRGLPEAFQVVREWLPLVELTLVEVLTLTKKMNSTDDANVLRARLDRCQKKADNLQEMFEEMTWRSTKEYVPSVYQSIASQLGNHRAETLMGGIVGDLLVLVVHPVFQTVRQETVESLEQARHELANVPPSLLESKKTIMRIEETPQHDESTKKEIELAGIAAVAATRERLEKAENMEEEKSRREHEELTRQIEREAKLVAEQRAAEEQEEKLAAAVRAETERIEAAERAEEEAKAAAAKKAAEEAERLKKLWAEAEAYAAAAKKTAEEQNEKLEAAVRAEQESMKAVQRAEAEVKAATARKAVEETEWWKKLEAEAKLAAELATRQKLEEERMAAEVAKAAVEAAAAARNAEGNILKQKILEDAREKAEEANVKKEKPPIKFKDALGRKFSFPFQLCQTWQVS